MTAQDHEAPWLTSTEARTLLRVSTCELAHLRKAGKLRFQKRGNAFHYLAEDCRRFAENRPNTSTGSCFIDHAKRGVCY